MICKNLNTKSSGSELVKKISKMLILVSMTVLSVMVITEIVNSPYRKPKFVLLLTTVSHYKLYFCINYSEGKPFPKDIAEADMEVWGSVFHKPCEPEILNKMSKRHTVLVYNPEAETSFDTDSLTSDFDPNSEEAKNNWVLFIVTKNVGPSVLWGNGLVGVFSDVGPLIKNKKNLKYYYAKPPIWESTKNR